MQLANEIRSSAVGARVTGTVTTVLEDDQVKERMEYEEYEGWSKNMKLESFKYDTSQRMPKFDSINKRRRNHKTIKNVLLSKILQGQ